LGTAELVDFVMMHRRKTYLGTAISRPVRVVQAGSRLLWVGVFPHFIEISMDVGLRWHEPCVACRTTAP